MHIYWECLENRVGVSTVSWECLRVSTKSSKMSQFFVIVFVLTQVVYTTFVSTFGIGYCVLCNKTAGKDHPFKYPFHHPFTVPLQYTPCNLKNV